MQVVQIIDLGINNLLSLVGAFEEIFCDVSVVGHGTELITGGTVVLPGTGSFGEAMRRLESQKFSEALFKRNEQAGRIVGICLGMQLLGEGSEETPNVKGLGLVPGGTQNLRSLKPQSARVPHVGWSSVSRHARSDFGDLSVLDGTDFYFSHSYHFAPTASPTIELLTAEFGDDTFVAGMRSEHLVGLQFHPEKSGSHGLRLLTELVGIGDG